MDLAGLAGTPAVSRWPRGLGVPWSPCPAL